MKDLNIPAIIGFVLLVTVAAVWGAQTRAAEAPKPDTHRKELCVRDANAVAIMNDSDFICKIMGRAEPGHGTSVLVYCIGKNHDGYYAVLKPNSTL
jgi:hypothetical protein